MSIDTMDTPRKTSREEQTGYLELLERRRRGREKLQGKSSSNGNKGECTDQRLNQARGRWRCPHGNDNSKHCRHDEWPKQRDKTSRVAVHEARRKTGRLIEKHTNMSNDHAARRKNETHQRHLRMRPDSVLRHGFKRH